MNYSSVSPQEFMKMTKEPGVFLVRAPISYPKVIEGTNLIMETEDLGIYADKLPVDKSTKILVYCRRGNASRYVSQLFLDEGYKNVINLEGGLFNLLGIEE